MKPLFQQDTAAGILVGGTLAAAVVGVEWGVTLRERTAGGGRPGNPAAVTARTLLRSRSSAPASKTPRAPGERIKTDRRDAELLVRLLMPGQLRPVAIPTLQLEGLRDLTRARDRVRHDLLRARHRVSKLLLRYGRMWPSDRGTWTQQHHHWLARQRFGDPNLELAYRDGLAAVDTLVRRRDMLDQRLLVAAQDAEVASAVARLRAFRGINTITALGLHAEIHDWHVIIFKIVPTDRSVDRAVAAG